MSRFGYSSFAKNCAGLTAGLVLAGCGAPSNETVAIPDYPDVVPLERCFESPQPPAPDLYRDASDLPVLPINRSSEGYIADDPGPLSPETVQAVAGAAVKIEVGLGQGTGALVSTEHGNVVVTAAHVTVDVLAGGEQNAAHIQVTDQNGNEGRVIGACYMYETSGEFSDLTSGEVNRTDVAILRLGTPIGSGALSLAAAEEPRGSWDPAFYSFQGGRNVEEPAIFGGIVVTDSQFADGGRILTGIQSGQTCGITAENDWESDCAFERGGSGSPIINRNTAELIGVAVSGTRTAGQRCMTNESLASYNVSVNFPSCPSDEQAWPIMAGVVPLTDIERALSSEVYRQP